MSNPVLQIGPRLVGSNWEPLIIAELGINHGGSLSCAKHMVDLAARSGCECIKHQTHFVNDEMTEEAKDIVPAHAHDSIWSIIERCALSKDAEIELKHHAESLGLIYISTPFSRAAADFLAEIDVPAFKIGSGECDNVALVNHIASLGKPVIMSTGMHVLEDIRPSVELLRKASSQFGLLECTNVYPCPPDCVSLKGIDELRAAFPDAVIGYSDHTIGEHIALAAIAKGASIVEKHFTDTMYRAGPDIPCSMDPVQLRSLISKAGDIFSALRDVKRRTRPEEDVYNFARGSVVADSDLKAGQVLAADNLWVRRPGTGEIPASDYFEILGKKVTTSVRRNQQLKWSDIEI